MNEIRTKIDATSGYGLFDLKPVSGMITLFMFSRRQAKNCGDFALTTRD